MLTRTRLVASPEPDPLAVVTVYTRSWFSSVDLVLGQIDRLLESFVPTSVDLLADAVRHRTRLQDETELLALPLRTTSAPHRQSKSVSDRAAHLDRCLDELQSWLGVGLADVCTAAGINRGTVYAWRARRSHPRPGTVSGVLRLHGLVSSAVGAVGEAQARGWFHAGNPSPLDRLRAAAGELAITTAVGRELRRGLTSPPLPPPNPLLAATLDDSPARPLT